MNIHKLKFNISEDKKNKIITVNVFDEMSETNIDYCEFRTNNNLYYNFLKTDENGTFRYSISKYFNNGTIQILIDEFFDEMNNSNNNVYFWIWNKVLNFYES